MALIQLVVERDANECTVKIAGVPYRFKRDAEGRLVADITNTDHLKWVSDPYHYGSFKVLPPKGGATVEKVESVSEVSADAIMRPKKKKG